MHTPSLATCDTVFFHANFQAPGASGFSSAGAEPFLGESAGGWSLQEDGELSDFLQREWLGCLVRPVLSFV